jgi:hypothetical protein
MSVVDADYNDILKRFTDELVNSPPQKRRGVSTVTEQCRPSQKQILLLMACGVEADKVWDLSFPTRAGLQDYVDEILEGMASPPFY